MRYISWYSFDTIDSGEGLTSQNTKAGMRLSQKLWLFTILTLIIPTIIIAVYSGWLVYINSERSQYRYLDSIFSKIESDFTEFETLYLDESKIIAESSYVKDKLYVYSKYWDRIKCINR